MLEPILLTVSHYWQLVLPVLIVAYIASNYFNNGLHKYPGPALARFSDIWRFIDVWNRRPDTTHIKLHRQHGDIVRLGPNTLSFSDPAAIKTIYGLNKGFVKVRTLRTASIPANGCGSPASTHLNRLSLVANVFRLYSAQQTNLTMPTSAARLTVRSACPP